jgi:hypothetical protein
MSERPIRWAKNIFEVVVTAIEKEEAVLKGGLQRYPGDGPVQDPHGKGPAASCEKALREILSRAFEKHREFLVNTEIPHQGKDRHRQCDLCVCDSKAGKRTWIDIKAMGFCTEDQYETGLKAAAVNLQAPSKEVAGKYLLVTSVGIDEPKEVEWKGWFQKEMPEALFSGQLFKSLKIVFPDGKPFRQGYYTICLLRVRDDSAQ